MHFEEGLVYELESIEGLNDKVFPLYAEEGEQPPFLVYASSEGETTQTLDGWTMEKRIICEIHVIAKSYGKMKILAKAVIDKLMTFQGRAIGIDGPVVKSLSFEQPVEVHDKDYQYYRTSFELIVRI
jgi:hypothetical protein